MNDTMNIDSKRTKTINVKFYLDGKNGEKEKNIMLTINSSLFKNNRFKMGISEKIKTNQWLEGKMKARESMSYPEGKDINTKLDDWSKAAKNAFERTADFGQKGFRETVRAEYAALNNLAKGDTMRMSQWLHDWVIENPEKEVFDAIVGTYRPLETTGLKHYENLMNHLLHFEEMFGLVVYSDYFDQPGYIQFRRYMDVAELTPGRKLGRGKKNLVTKLKATLRKMKAEGFGIDEDFIDNREFSYNVDAVDKFNLVEEDIKVLEEATDLSPKLDKVRDIFLCQYYCARRYSEMRELRLDHTETLEDGNEYFVMFSEKHKHIQRKKKILVPMAAKVVRILEKWKDKGVNGLPLYTQSSQFSKPLKQLLEHLEITDPEDETIKQLKKDGQLGSHLARRSWCSVHFEKNWPLRVMMALTDHETEEMFLRYIGYKSKLGMLTQLNEKMLKE